MHFTYANCYNLTGSPVCGESVTTMSGTYINCYNLSSNGYLYSNKVTNMRGCFNGRNTSKYLNLYVPANSTTLNTALTTSSTSMVWQTITWTNDMPTNGCYYNTAHNIYIYPVDDVAAARAANGD